VSNHTISYVLLDFPTPDFIHYRILPRTSFNLSLKYFLLLTLAAFVASIELSAAYHISHFHFVAFLLINTN